MQLGDLSHTMNCSKNILEFKFVLKQNVKAKNAQ